MILNKIIYKYSIIKISIIGLNSLFFHFGSGISLFEQKSGNKANQEKEYQLPKFEII